jgi:hypothetical protein
MQGKAKDADNEFKKFEELIKAKDAKQAKIMGGSSH